MHSIRSAPVAVAAGFMFTNAAHAQPHAGDVTLAVEQGVIRTGIYSNGLFTSVRLFSATLGVVGPNFTADPGFDCLPRTFPVPSRNGFAIRGPLQAWNGAAFEPALPARMNISFATLGADSPTTAQVVTGFTLSVGSNGQWHRHFDYTLSSGARDGVYLLELELFSTNAAVAPSEPFWILFNQNASSEAMTLAASWVESHLIQPPVCPADFNQDGGIDGGDIESFFLAWEVGDAAADVNIDGGVDGADIESFFVAWQNGGC
ncbi:MAG: hypothetical protein NTV94_01535 [Planctomycetota bacterium]|nr:hypothetical protein [Planctomycetota bacterium]